MNNPIYFRPIKVLSAIQLGTGQAALVLICIGSILLPGAAHAAIITGITIESATLGTNPNMSPSDAIDGSGLPDGTPALSGTHSTVWNHHWYGSGTTPQITIDLEGSYDLDTIHIWNFNESGASLVNRGLQNVEIYAAPDENEANLAKLTTDGSGVHDNGSGDFRLPIASATPDYTGFDLDLSSITNAELLSNARLIRIQGLDTYGEANGGLAEVQFGTAIPEPQAASLLAALAVLSVTLLRRRR